MRRRMIAAWLAFAVLWSLIPTSAFASQSVVEPDGERTARAGEELEPDAPGARRETEPDEVEPDGSRSARNPVQTLERPVSSEDQERICALSTADGTTVRITVRYSPEARVPEDAELTAAELTVARENQRLPRESQRLVNQRRMDRLNDLMGKAVGLGDTDEVFASRLLDIRLVSDGSAVQPAAPVEITLETEYPAQRSDCFEAALYCPADGYNRERAVALAVENVTGSGDVSALRLVTDRLDVIGVLGVTGVMDRWSSEDTLCTLRGPRTLSAHVRHIKAEPGEGMELVDAFRVEVEPEQDHDVELTLSAETEDDTLTGTRLADGKALFARGGTTARILAGEQVALFREAVTEADAPEETAARKALQEGLEDPAARIAETGTGYPTLADAITAVESGQTVELLRDVTEAVDTQSKPFTLDLKGHSLTASQLTSRALLLLKNGRIDIGALDIADNADLRMQALYGTIQGVTAEQVDGSLDGLLAKPVEGGVRICIPVTVGADNKKKSYGDEDPALTATVTGVMAGDSVSYTLSRTEGENVGEYTITPTGEEEQGFYQLTFLTGTLTVDPRAVTVIAGDKEKVYGEADPELTATVTDVVTGDSVSYTLSRAEGENVGDYAITPAGDSEQGNYYVTFVPGTLTVNPRPVTVTAEDKSKVYGEADPELTAVVSGTLGEDTVSFTLQRDEGEDAGTYAITPVGEGEQGNYQVTCIDGIFTIQPKPVTVTVTGRYVNTTYDAAEHTASGYDLVISEAGYSEGNISFYGANEVSRIDSGTSYMGLRADEFENVNDNYDVTFNVTDGYVTIAPLEGVAVTITGRTGTYDYDGQEHTVSDYDVSISTALYTADDFQLAGLAEASRTDAGTTSMGLTAEKFENTNSNFTDVTFTVTDGYVTINPIDVTVTITGETDTSEYDGQPHSVSGYEAEASNALYDVFNDFTFSGTAEASRTDAGTTSMGLTADQFVNTNTNFSHVTFEVTDGSQTVTPIDAVVTITGHTGTFDYDGQEHTVSGYDVEIEEGSLYTADDFQLREGSASVSRTHAGNTPMGLSAARFENRNTNFHTVTFEVEDGWVAIEPIDATVTITGRTGTFDYDGTEHHVTGYSAESSTPLYQVEGSQRHFTFTGTADARRTEAGVTEMELSAGQFANTNPDFDNVTFEITKGWVIVNPKVQIGKTLHDDLAETPRDFRFSLELLDENNAPEQAVTLASGVVTDSEGKAVFTLSVKDGDSAWQDLIVPYGATLKVREELGENPENYLTTINGSVEDNNQIDLDSVTSSITVLEYVNEKQAVCRIGNQSFQTLAKAVEYAYHYEQDATIEMLMDYRVPDGDVVEIPALCDLTLVTSNDYDGEGGAVISRSSAYSALARPMIRNEGTLRIGDGEHPITLDGNSGITAAQPMIESTGSLYVNDKATLRHAASSGNGGAIKTDGTVVLSGGTISGCSAAMGGGIYSTGTVKLQAGSIAGCSAGQWGGGVFGGTGTVDLDGADITGCSAGQWGGGVCVTSGSVSMTAGSITGCSALNGSGLYLLSGFANFNGGEIRENRAVAATGSEDGAAEGGAVGMGTEYVRLNFSGTPKVTENTMETGTDSSDVASNVYLNQDSDLIINSLGLNVSGGAVVGVYVPGTGTLYQNRGVTRSRFGTYSTQTGVDAFRNDRTPGMRVDPVNSRMVWGKGLKVEIWEWSPMTGIPALGQGTKKNRNDIVFYPVDTENHVSDVAAKLMSEYNVITAGNTYAFAFVKVTRQVDEHTTQTVLSPLLSEINWDNAHSGWSFLDREGNPVNNVADPQTLVVYYAPPTYLSMKNNTRYPLSLSALTVNGIPVAQSHFGLVVAKNGETATWFVPVEPGDLNLNPGQSVKLMFPGVRGKTYSLSGAFGGAASEDIEYSRTGDSTGSVSTDGEGNFTLADADLLSDGGTVSIIFGGTAKICKIVEMGDHGNVVQEHTYATLTDAVADATAHYAQYKVQESWVNPGTAASESYETVKIEMLQDYLISTDDAPVIPTGKTITFTTAKQGETKGDLYYSGAGAAQGGNGRAKISRDQGNSASFFQCTAGDNNTCLRVEELDFDGKQLNSGTNGGVVSVNAGHVILRNVKLENFTAKNGGAVFVGNAAGTEAAADLLVENGVFNNCISTATEDRWGGGAIWTSGPTMGLYGCSFTYCNATQQGGAVFHRVDASYANRKVSTATVKGCSFEHCWANAGGGLELNTYHGVIDGCSFDDCQAKTRNGGGYNAYMQTPGEASFTDMTIRDSTFTNCFANQDGGVFRTMMNTVCINSTFTSNIANGDKTNGGGGIAETNVNSTLVLDGCTISQNISGKMGGGVYTAGNLTMLHGTSITGNRLTGESVGNAAGVYMPDGKTLTLGAENSSELDTCTVSGNTTANGEASNLRLPMNKTVNANSVVVRSSFTTGEDGSKVIGVLNAAAAGTQFGSTSGVTSPRGFSDGMHIFRGDHNELYGILKRSSPSQIVWRGSYICKITDNNRDILYFDQHGEEPALFDHLDDGTATPNADGAFSLLKNTRGNLKLYRADGSRYGDGDDETTFCVEMLIQEYDCTNYITSNQSNTWLNVVLTTARESGDYPYRGTPGTVSTIRKRSGFHTGSNLITAKVNLTLTNIVLDGNNIPITKDGGGIALMKQNDNAVLTIGTGAVLKNGIAQNCDGGGVIVKSGSLVIDGGRIINCSASNGGAVCLNAGKSCTIRDGSIEDCSATASGGGIYINAGTLEMSGGTISGCRAGASGGGVFLAGGKSMTMTDRALPGGARTISTITGNSAATAGGGIAVGSTSSKLNFSGNCVVDGNTKDGADKCNVELNQNSWKVINTTGLGEEARIGVFVPDANGLYNQYGVKDKTFARWTTSDARFFQFVNDRNDLRGAKRPGKADEVWWQEMQSLLVTKTVVSDRVSDKNLSFHFVVALEQPINDTFGSGSTAMHFVNGVAEFDLKHGEYKEAVYLPTVNISGSYTVTETPDPGFTTTVERNVRNWETGEFGAPGQHILVHTAAFTNTRTTGSLSVTKTLGNPRPEDASREFTFTVILSDSGIQGTFGDMTFTKGVATFTLKGGETKTASDLPTGITYSINETPDSDFNTSATVTRTVAGTPETTAAGERVTQTDLCAGDNLVVFHNERKVGGLQVIHRVVSGLDADTARSFHYKVKLTDTSINGTYGTGSTAMTFVNGVAEFDVSGASATVTAVGLPSGVGYTVTGETPAYFSLKKSRPTGTIGNEIAQSVFTYTRLNGRLTVRKQIVSDRSADSNEVFRFKLELGHWNEGAFVKDAGIDGKTYSGVEVRQGEGSFTITGRGSKSITGLPQGVAYRVTEEAKDGFTNTDSTGDTGTITGTTSTAVFENTRRTGSLTVRKTLVSDLASDGAQEFTFSVRLGDSKFDKTCGEGESAVTFTKGLATFTLKGGEERTITGLPSDVSYSVSETANGGFTTQSTGSSGTIQPDTAAEAVFTNTRKTGSLTVSKILKNAQTGDSERSFSFTVTLGDSTIQGTYGGMTFTNGAASFTLKGGESVTAEGLPSTVAYTVAETEDSDFTATSVRASGSITTGAVNAVFTNTRRSGKLTVKKVVESDLYTDQSRYYQFTITLSDTTLTHRYGTVQFTDGVATIRVKGGRSVTISGLPQGVGYTVTEEALTGMETVSTGESGTIGMSTNAVAEFKNTRLTGELVVKKTLVSDLAADRDQEFTFNVRLGDSRINGTYGVGSNAVTFTKGQASFTLKGGQEKTITGLPRGVSFYVSESETHVFTTIITTSDSDSEESKNFTRGTISETPFVAEFTNTRKTGTLQVKKRVDSDLDEDKTKPFRFRVKLSDESINQTYGTVTFTNGKAEFNLTNGTPPMTIRGLPMGVGYAVTEVTADPMFDTVVPVNARGTISADSTPIVEFLNRRKQGGLTVSKQVQSPLEEDLNQQFHFTVRLNDTSIGAPTDEKPEGGETYGEGETAMTFYSGEANFELKNGQQKTALKLPAGAEYTVEEATVDGFLPVPARSGTIDPNKALGAAFVNVRAVCKLTTADGDLLYRRQGGQVLPAAFGTLEEGFAALSAALYTDSAGRTAFDETALRLEMLVPEYALGAGVAVPAAKQVTLTTALKTANHFPYVGEEGTAAVIRRSAAYGSMIEDNGSLTLTNIVLDGGWKEDGTGFTANGDGGIVNVPDGGTLTVTDRAVLRSSAVSGNGGAVCVAGGAAVICNGGRLTGNRCGGDGAGFYLSDGSTLEISGAPEFTDNVKTGATVHDPADEASEIPAAQDIFLKEAHEDAPASLIVAGDLTGEAGSIRVWAESPYHCVQLMPFAQRKDGVVFTAANHFEVFRNARDNADTENGTDNYLHGTVEDHESERFVYWNGISGTRQVILRKVTSDYTYLSGAKFTVYRGESSSAYVLKTKVGDEVQTQTLEDLTAAGNGVFWIGSLPYGTYYLHETYVPTSVLQNTDGWWYTLNVSETGYTVSSQRPERSET